MARRQKKDPGRGRKARRAPRGRKAQAGDAARALLDEMQRQDLDRSEAEGLGTAGLLHGDGERGEDKARDA